MSKSGKVPSILRLTKAVSPASHIIVDSTGGCSQGHEQEGEKWGSGEEIESSRDLDGASSTTTVGDIYIRREEL
jgi:hypothetical protein